MSEARENWRAICGEKSARITALRAQHGGVAYRPHDMRTRAAAAYRRACALMVAKRMRQARYGQQRASRYVSVV